MLHELQQLGLSAQEAKVYVLCVTSGITSPADLVRGTGYRRSTIYGYIRSLQDKGLIYQQINGRKRLYTPAKPELALANLVQSEKEAVVAKERIVQKISSRLKTKLASNLSDDTAIVLKGRAGAIYVIDKMIAEKRDNYWIGSLDRLFAVMGQEDVYRRLTIRRLKQTTTAYAITDRGVLNNQRFSERLGKFRKHRYIENLTEINSGVQIFGDYIALGQYGHGPEDISTTLIHSRELARLVKKIFFELWNRLSDEPEPKRQRNDL